MALNKAGLESALLGLFEDPSLNLVTLAEQWGYAMQVFFSGVAPASTTVSTAIAAFKAALPGAFAGGPASVDALLTALVTTIGGGMAGFAPVPPALPVLSPNLAPPWPATHAAAAAKWATIFDTWAKTGVSSTLPSGPVIPWT